MPKPASPAHQRTSARLNTHTICLPTGCHHSRETNPTCIPTWSLHFNLYSRAIKMHLWTHSMHFIHPQSHLWHACHQVTQLSHLRTVFTPSFQSIQTNTLISIFQNLHCSKHMNPEQVIGQNVYDPKQNLHSISHPHTSSHQSFKCSNTNN